PGVAHWVGELEQLCASEEPGRNRASSTRPRTARLASFKQEDLFIIIYLNSRLDGANLGRVAGSAVRRLCAQGNARGKSEQSENAYPFCREVCQFRAAAEQFHFHVGIARRRQIGDVFEPLAFFIERLLGLIEGLAIDTGQTAILGAQSYLGLPARDPH